MFQWELSNGVVVPEVVVPRVVVPKLVLLPLIPIGFTQMGFECALHAGVWVSISPQDLRIHMTSAPS